MRCAMRATRARGAPFTMRATRRRGHQYDARGGDCGEGRAAFSETRRGAFAFGTTTSVGSKFRASTMFTELGSMLLAKWGAGRTAVVDGRAARK